MNLEKKLTSKYPYIVIGLCLILLYYLPYFILGENSSFRIVDFLDDEVIQYLYSGKYLFSYSDTIVNEWLGGAPLATIQPPCFMLVIFFKYFSFYTAIIISSIFGTVCAFIGMFLLCNELLENDKKYIAFMAAFLFSILPYYPPYGLSSVGIPLVIWAYIKIHTLSQYNQNCNTLTYMHKCIPYYLVCIFYALSSSLVWAGYFLVGFSVLYSVFMFIKKQKSALYSLLASLLMILTYCFTFRHTIVNILFETYTSHRSDPGRTLSASEFWPTFYPMFKYGQFHAPSLHTYILLFSFCVIILGIIFYKKLEKSTKLHLILAAGLWILFLLIAAFYGCFNTEIVLNIRQYLGPLSTFQLDRIYWLNPTIWYMELALTTSLLLNIVGFFLKKEHLLQVFCVGFVLLIGCYFTNYIIHHINSAEYYSNIEKITGKNTSYWSYNEFYDHELFTDIKEYIGLDQNEYRIGCVGFVPAIAQVNGFYTVDAYCTNYPLEYKYRFRKVIEKELEKDSYLKSYFDDWGNRCYLFSSELGTKFQTGKDEQIVLQDFDINTDALRDLGCDYIFSAVKIENSHELGITLLDVFTTDTSRIEIYLYQL